MFTGGSKIQPRRPSKRSENADNSVTILTSGCHFQGKLYCSGATRVGGLIEGEIVSEGVLIVEDKAKICATIKAEEVIIQGVVEGKIEAQIRLEICQSGKFSGEIITPSLVIREGAQFSGRSVMPSDGVFEQLEATDEKVVPEVTSTLGSIESSVPEVSLL